MRLFRSGVFEFLLVAPIMLDRAVWVSRECADEMGGGGGGGGFD